MIKDTQKKYVTIRRDDYNKLCKLVLDTVNAVILESASQSYSCGKLKRIPALEPCLKLRDLVDRINANRAE